MSFIFKIYSSFRVRQYKFHYYWDYYSKQNTINNLHSLYTNKNNELHNFKKVWKRLDNKM